MKEFYILVNAYDSGLNLFATWAAMTTEQRTKVKEYTKSDYWHQILAIVKKSSNEI
jgi:hypothetical protein